MTYLKVVFKANEICNSTQYLAQPQMANSIVQPKIVEVNRKLRITFMANVRFASIDVFLKKQNRCINKNSVPYKDPNSIA